MKTLDELISLARVVASDLEQVANAQRLAGARVLLGELPAARPMVTTAILGLVARRYLHLRRMRETRFPRNIFADPAWDLLLDLFAAEAEGKLVSVSSACIAAAVPATTALRWISLLESEGLVERVSDPSDRRRAYLKLCEDARGHVADWLAETFV